LPDKLFRVRRGRQNIQTLRQRLHLSTCHLLGGAQRFFGAFAFRDIDNRAHELDQVTELIANRMTDRVIVPNSAARANNPVICFEVRFVANRVFEQVPDSDLVLRTKALKKCFESWRSGFRIETKDAISLLRPVPDFARSRSPCPTARMNETLRYRMVSFAFAAIPFRQLALNVHAREICDVLDCLLLTRARAAWLAIIHGKRSDHFAFGGEDRRGPARAERMRQSQVAKISP